MDPMKLHETYIMGPVWSLIHRQVARVNIENRAHRVISKEKPTVAPKYPSTVNEIEKIMKEYPESAEQHLKKFPQHDQRLKQVYVRSHDPHSSFEGSERQASSHLLPVDRTQVMQPEFGYQEPPVIPQGYCSLRQALKFISDHQADPKTWSIGSISKEYALKESDTGKILHYYRTFQLFVPQTQGQAQTKFATPSVEKMVESGNTPKKPG